MKSLLIVLLTHIFLMIFEINVSANDYYISNTGNDSAKGTSPESSFKTLDRLNKVKLRAGDKIFFKSGDVFTGTLQINYSGKEGSPIVLSSYGKGEKPILTGAMKIEGFTAEGNNIHSAPTNENIKYLFKDDQVLILARYPDSGFLKIDDGGEQHLVDYDMPFSENQLEGTRAHVQFYVWLYKYGEISSNTSNTIHFKTTFNPDTNRSHSCQTGRDYYLDNSKLFLDNANEWYYDKQESKISVFSEIPLDKNEVFEGAFVENGIVLSKGVSHVKIENLKISGQTGSGIIGMGDNKNIVIQNNELTKIGKYGVYLEKYGSKVSIKDNFIHDIFGNAIRTMHVSNSLIEGNRVENIGTITGYGISGLNNASGICVLNYEKDYKDTLTLSRHNMIRDNYIYNVGYNGIRFEGYNTICEKNIVKNCVNTLHDGGMIYTWGRDTMYTFNNVIKDNIVIGGNSQSKESHDIQIGIYLDNNVRDITVSNNIVSNVRGGMMTNWASTRSVFTGNLVYGTETGIMMTVLNEECFANHSVTGNRIIIMKNLGKTIVIGNHRGTKLASGIIDNNIYVAPNEKFHIRTIRVDKDKKSEIWLTLQGWQQEMGLDMNSTFFEPEKDGVKYQFSDIFINENDYSKTLKLDPEYTYIDLQGNPLSKEITLDARQAKVVFYR